VNFGVGVASNAAVGVFPGVECDAENIVVEKFDAVESHGAHGSS
jgi:hypothetical protein